jgi:hypothetical protein
VIIKESDLEQAITEGLLEWRVREVELIKSAIMRFVTDYKLQPLDLKEAKEALELSESARPGPWKVHNDNEDTEYPPFWVIGKDVDEDSDEAMELYVGDDATADFVAKSRTLLPSLAKRFIDSVNG